MIIYKNLKLFIIIIFFSLSTSFTTNASSMNGIDVDLHVGSCNNNGICESGNEDFFVCPADCTPIIVPPTPGQSNGGSLLVMDNVFNDLTVEVSYTSAIIKWKSAIPTMSNLKWGINPDYKDGVIRNVDYLLQHEVLITGLKEGTLYYFNIEASNLLGKTNSLENQIFRTLSLLDITPPSNPTNVKATSIPGGINISWLNPTEDDFDYIRVMKNDDRFYGSPFMGYLVYEGKGNYFVDSNVKEGNKYYYTLFSRDRAGNYSSGALVDIIHNPKGLDTWGSNLTPIEKVTPINYSFIVNQGSSSYDFKVGSIFNLSGDYPINIKTDYFSNIKNDDMWVTIRNSDRMITWQYFFSRIRDKEGFLNVAIPSFEEGGYYNISIYRYNQENTQLINQGAFQISKNLVKIENSYEGYIFWILLLLLLLIIIFLLFKVILPKLYKRFRDKY